MCSVRSRTAGWFYSLTIPSPAQPVFPLVSSLMRRTVPCIQIVTNHEQQPVVFTWHSSHPATSPLFPLSSLNRDDKHLPVATAAHRIAASNTDVSLYKRLIHPMFNLSNAAKKKLGPSTKHRKWSWPIRIGAAANYWISRIHLRFVMYATPMHFDFQPHAHTHSFSLSLTHSHAPLTLSKRQDKRPCSIAPSSRMHGESAFDSTLA